MKTVIGLIALTFTFQQSAFAMTTRVQAIANAESFATSGALLDQYGHSVAEFIAGTGSFVALIRADLYRDGCSSGTYVVKLELVNDRSSLGGYRDACVGTIEVDASTGIVLSPEAAQPSDFSCRESE